MKLSPPLGVSGGILVALLLTLALVAPTQARSTGPGEVAPPEGTAPLMEPDSTYDPEALAAEKTDLLARAAARPAMPLPAASTLPAALPALPPISANDLAGAAIPPRRVSRGDTSLPRVALTFDTGQGTPTVRAILEELQAANVHATFFLVGAWAAQNPDVVRAIVAGGHDLGNHSYSHPNFDNLSDDQMLAQMVWTENIVQQITGCTTRPFFRPPFGAVSAHTLTVVAEAGFESILWSAHGGDWLAGATAESVHDLVVQNTGSGTIIILHSSVPATAQALPLILADLRARGLQLVTLSELLAADPAQPYRAPCR